LQVARLSDAPTEPPLDPPPPARWLNRSVLGICLATLLSDFSHEMCTGVLPLYLASLSLGPASLGVIEGIADFLVSISKLFGGLVGHLVHRKQLWASFGYLVTALATSGIALVRTLPAVASLRAVAWIARGYRSPLRDDLMAQAVPKTHFGRAYGLERAGDMLGAVAGPLTAAIVIWHGWNIQSVILIAFVPGVFAFLSMLLLVRQRRPQLDRRPAESGDRRIPKSFILLLVGVLLFGLGDFSRAFLILLLAQAGGISVETGAASHGSPAAVIALVMYASHNAISALAAYPIGWLGDRCSKLAILTVGYALGVLTNLLLAGAGGSYAMLLSAVVLSGIYIAVEETLEKAVAAEQLPPRYRSVGFGILAGVNSVGDMVSSIYVGYFLEHWSAAWAFGVAAGFDALGVVWLAALLLKR
jgi:MFS family permease